MKTAVSLFTGCGGSDTGLTKAGFTVLMANDILAYAKDVYEANLPKTDYQLGSINSIMKFPKADLLAGCYPCQGFSQGGARKAGRKLNYLYVEFARALRIIKPKAFIVENVSGMIRSDFKHLLDDQIKLFTEAEYRVVYNVLNASEYGVPQERKRIFIVGIRNDYGIDYCFPSPTHGPGRSNDFVSIKTAIGDMNLWPSGEFHEDDFHWYYMSRNRWRGWEELSKTIVSHPRHMPLHPVSPRLVRIHTDKWIWEHDGPKRRFSYNEAARLQGFGRDFFLPDTNNSNMRMKYQVVGNAVPPQLFKEVAISLPEIW